MTALLICFFFIIAIGAWVWAGVYAGEKDLKNCERRHKMKCFHPGIHRSLWVFGPLAFLYLDKDQ